VQLFADIASTEPQPCGNVNPETPVPILALAPEISIRSLEAEAGLSPSKLYVTFTGAPFGVVITPAIIVVLRPSQTFISSMSGVGEPSSTATLNSAGCTQPG